MLSFVPPTAGMSLLLLHSHSSQFNSPILFLCTIWLLLWRLRGQPNHFKVGDWKHLFLMRSYYFHNSQSFAYRNQTVVATMFSLEHKGLDILDLDLQCIISTGHTLIPLRSAKAQILGTFESNGACKLDLYLALCQFQAPYTLRHLDYKIDGKLFQQTNVETVSTAKRLTLVSCPGRIYNFERWQLFVTMMELYASYGVQLTVVHVHSVHAKIFELLELYRETSMLELRPYMELPDGLSTIRFNPNAETPWTNQAQHTQDCLLTFRESAEFVIFGDWDDIIHVPNRRPLLSVIRYFFAIHKNAASMYIERFDANLVTLDMMSAKNMTIFDYWAEGIDYSLKRRLDKDARVTDGKSIVRPDKALGVGHIAYLLTEGYRSVKIPHDKLHMVHARLHEPIMQDVLPLGHLSRPFRNRIGDNNRLVLSVLPKREVLVAQVQRCFDSLLSVLADGGTKCPSGMACPRSSYRKVPGVQCMRSRSTWGEVVEVPVVVLTGQSREDRSRGVVASGARRHHRLLISSFHKSELFLSDECF